jgi:drug/metabolite transporter (DMT)-like permease
MKRFYSDLGLVAVALIWGLTFPVIKIALDSSSAFSFNTVRFFLASLFFLPIARKLSVDGLKIGLMVFLGYTFQTVGMEYTTATNAGFITTLYVVFTPLISLLLYEERIDGIDTVLAFTALSGVYLISGYGEAAFGDFLILLCAIFFAAEIAMISHYSKSLNPTELAFSQVLATGFLSAIPASLRWQMELNSDVVIAIAITAFFATFLAKMLQNHLQRHTTSFDAAIIFSLEGVFAYMFSALMLAETLTPKQYVGAALIVASAMLVSARALNKQ